MLTDKILFFWTLLSKFLQKDDISKVSSVCVFRERSTWLNPQIKLFSVTEHHGNSKLIKIGT